MAGGGAVLGASLSSYSSSVATGEESFSGNLDSSAIVSSEDSAPSLSSSSSCSGADMNLVIRCLSSS